MDRAIDPRPARRRRRLMLVGLVAVALGLLVVMGSSLGGSRVRITRDRISTGMAERAVFKEYIPVTGNVLPIRTVFLDAVQGGVVEEVFLEDGHAIEVGTPILKLGNQQFQMDAINREAQLLDQQNNLRNTRLNMDQQTNNWKQQLVQLDYEMKQIERTWEMNDALASKGLVATQEHARSREEYDLAKQRRALLVANIRNDSLFRRTQEGQINSSLELIQDNLKFLHQALENLTIKAPISGQLSGLRAEVGQTVTQGSRIAQIDVLDGLKVRVRVGEHYVGRVYEGIEGTFQFGGKEYRLKVIKIFPEVNNGEFEVDMHFVGDVPDAIRRGQSLQVRMQLSEEQQAVIVPRGSWFQDTGGTWVYVVKEGIAVKREVKLGRQNPDHYEVLEGLEPGEEIITSRYEGFNNAEEIVIE
jgi:HlyD family secretion protein